MIAEVRLNSRWAASLSGILAKHVPEVEVWVYGSRVGASAHEGSDLDLVLIGARGEPIPAERLSAVVEALRESDIPIRVDVQDWARVPAAFREEIARRHHVFKSSC